MTQSFSQPARAFATLAVACSFVVLIVVVAISLGGDGGDSRPDRPRGAAAKRHVPASYVVQNGDTLTSIAHRTGVSVARIEELNPGVDPQILVSGEKLKLR